MQVMMSKVLLEQVTLRFEGLIVIISGESHCSVISPIPFIVVLNAVYEGPLSIVVNNVRLSWYITHLSSKTKTPKKDAVGLNKKLLNQ